MNKLISCTDCGGCHWIPAIYSILNRIKLTRYINMFFIMFSIRNKSLTLSEFPHLLHHITLLLWFPLIHICSSNEFYLNILQKERIIFYSPDHSFSTKFHLLRTHIELLYSNVSQTLRFLFCLSSLKGCSKWSLLQHWTTQRYATNTTPAKPVFI